MDIIAKPFGYLLRFCYNITNSYALALLFFTLLFKLILLPLNIKQQKASQGQARIRPKEMAIRKRYAGRTDQNAKVELSNDLMRLYQEEKVSAAGGCLPLLIQLPIIYILYQIITKPLQYICMASSVAIGDLKAKIFELFGTGALNAANTSEKITKLFSDSGTIDKFNISEIQMLTVMEKNQGAFSAILEGHGLSEMVYPNFTIFGGAIDLASQPTFTSIMILIPIFAALFQFASTFIMKFFGPSMDMSAPGAEQTQKSMLYMNIIFPLITFFMAFSFPAILGLYWIYQSIFGTIIQIVLYKVYPIPVYTPEQIAEIEAEMNKDYVKPEIKSHTRSLHNIDEDDYEVEYVDKTDAKDENSENVESNGKSAVADETLSVLPPRRRYDKNGNKIRSLHFIDEDDEEDISSASSTENTLNSNEEAESSTPLENESASSEESESPTPSKNESASSEEAESPTPSKNESASSEESEKNENQDFDNAAANTEKNED